MMTFGDVKPTSAFAKQSENNITPVANSRTPVENSSTSWAEVQQNSKSPKPAYMRAGEIAEAQNQLYRQEMM